MPVCYANVTRSALFICSQRQTFVLHKALTAGMRSEAKECAKNREGESEKEEGSLHHQSLYRV